MEPSLQTHQQPLEDSLPGKRAVSDLDPQSLAAPPLDAPTEVIRLGEMGKVLLQAGRYQDALNQFEQALALHPHDIDSWCHRADALACLNRYDQAFESLNQAQELAGLDNPHLWVEKAVMLILLGRPKEALACCNRALLRQPDHVQAWLFRGVALHCLGHYKEAHRSYRRASDQPGLMLHNHMQRLCHDITVDWQAS